MFIGRLLTATAVAGRNAIVSAEMAFIAELSRFASLGIFNWR
jgi:hypothetical protein